MLPFLVVIVLGILEFGYYIYTYSELENATRRASEFASTAPPYVPSDPNDKCGSLARADALESLVLSDPDDIAISFNFLDSRVKGAQVEVTLTYQSSFLTPFAQQWFGTLDFQFTSRRTITSLDAPLGYDPQCSPL